MQHSCEGLDKIIELGYICIKNSEHEKIPLLYSRSWRSISYLLSSPPSGFPLCLDRLSAADFSKSDSNYSPSLAYGLDVPSASHNYLNLRQHPLYFSPQPIYKLCKQTHFPADAQPRGPEGLYPPHTVS